MSRDSRWRLAAVLAVMLLGACSGMPVALDPHGSNARQAARIAWVLLWGGASIFALVMALVAYAILESPTRRAWLGRRAFVIGAGIVFPVAALSALLFYTLTVFGVLASSRGAAPLRIEIVGQMWWWRVRYLDADGATVLVTANEMHIPVGRTIEFALESADVLHSFWVPNLGGKLDLIPGRVNVLRLDADRTGVFRGQCAEYCGAQHAKMAFYVVAHTAAEFDAWLAAQRLPGNAPRTPALQRGRALFVANCAGCHTVRGTAAMGELGPDLTHVGSRRSIGAGALPNNVGTIAGWIAASQHIKPENAMPSFDGFSGEELGVLAAYLESLK